MARTIRRTFTDLEKAQLVTEFHTLVGQGLNKSAAAKKLGVVYHQILRWSKMGTKAVVPVKAAGVVNVDGITSVEAFAFGLLARERVMKDLKKGLNLIDNTFSGL